MSIGITPEERDGIHIEFCSGYTDETGEWNAGFYCPRDSNSRAFFCCGTSTYKYCCTYKDLVEEDTFKSWYIIIGIVIGVSLTIVLTTVMCRSCCSAYKKINVHNQATGGPYQMQLSSTATSGIANMYSFPSHPPPQPIMPQEDGIGTSRAVSQLILELESQTVMNKSFSHHNHQIDSSGPDTTELCLPINCDGQPENIALDTAVENRMRTVTGRVTENSDDTNALYRSTKF